MTTKKLPPGDFRKKRQFALAFLTAETCIRGTPVRRYLMALPTRF